jgi:general secretion pathway protein C
LFGASTAPAPTTAGETAPIDAPETRLNLVLRGVLSSDDPKEARAIIAEPNGTENFFSVVAALPGGAELKEIYADRIILMRAGRHETLRLPREEMEGAINSRPEQGGVPGFAPVGDPSAVLGQYREQLAENPQALLDLARAVPAPAPGGGIAGFRLFPGNKPALFAQLGLQPGDLVKEVNGLVMDNPMRGAELMQRLRESNQLDLRIERAGQEINLSVAIP